MTELSMRKLGKIVKKLRLTSNSILMIKFGTELAEMDSLELLGEVIRGTGIENVVILVVNDFDDIKLMEEHKMNDMGWYKARTISTLIRRKGKNSDGPDKGIDKELLQ